MLPSTRTFDIPELREIILEYATAQDLLLWQRVNKEWQAAIQRSPRIQEKLFYRVGVCRDSYDEDRVIWNPFTDLFCIGCGTWMRFTRAFLYDGLDGKASHPTASWRRMLIPSPAATEVQFLILVTYRGGNTELLRESIICETGITMGQLAGPQKEGIGYRDDGLESESIRFFIKS